MNGSFYKSELWVLPPEGLGCSHCHIEPPVTSFTWGMLGFYCVARWFPSRSTGWLDGWFYRQTVLSSRLKASVSHQGLQLALEGL